MRLPLLFSNSLVHLAAAVWISALFTMAAPGSAQASDGDPDSPIRQELHTLEQHVERLVAATLVDGYQPDAWQRLRSDFLRLRAHGARLKDEPSIRLAERQLFHLARLEQLASQPEALQLYDTRRRFMESKVRPIDPKIITGMISGRVTRTLDGAPIADVSISAESGTDYIVGLTDSDGRFTLEVPAGEYAVVAADFLHVVELYDNIPCPFFCGYPNGDLVLVEAGSERSGSDFALDRRGIFTGKVTDSQSGQGIDAMVQAWDPERSIWYGPAFTESDGSYELNNLRAGTYYLVSEASGYRTEAFDNVPCALEFGIFDCADTAQTITVELNEAVNGLDFALDAMGSISGRVTDAGTGQGIPFPSVILESAETGSTIYTQGDETGRYQSPGLSSGDYFVHTENNDFYVDELYNNVRCSRDPYSVTCDTSAGTPVTVDLFTEVTGIDFALEPGGVITGTVTQTLDDAPIFTALSVLDTDGRTVAYGSSDETGRYEVKGLDSGPYRLVTESNTHANQVYDGVACSFETGCPTLEGDLVTVIRSQTTSNIDFELDRRGRIAGQVTDEQGLALPNIELGVYEAESLFPQIHSAHSDSEGRFEIQELIPGNYLLVARDPENRYIDTLYPDIPCHFGECDFSLGTVIAVGLNQTVGDFRIALKTSGSLTGTLKEAVTGLPVPFGFVEIYDSREVGVRFATSDERGIFEVFGLRTGQYYAVASGSSVVSNVFGVGDCPDLVFCPPLTGTPINVVEGEQTAGIDFEMTATGCHFADTNQCLGGGRFRVVAKWRDGAGDEGFGNFSYLTDDSTTFWFFDADNVEGVIKVLDACSSFDRYWIFGAGLTDVEVTLWVTDLMTGEMKTYVNPQGQAFEPIQDTDAFHTCGSQISSPTEPWSDSLTQGVFTPDAAKSCGTTSGELCLNGGRFAVQAFFQPPGGQEQLAGAVPLTGDSGYFWFFNESNVEILVKVLDACALIDRFWVFGAGLTDVRVRLVVTDTESGEVREYQNDQGNAFAPIQDTQAFATCF